MCSILIFNLFFGFLYRTIGGETPTTIFIPFIMGDNILSIKNYRSISQSSEIVAFTADDTTCSYLMDNLKNDSKFSCIKFTTMSQLIYMARKLAHNKVCAIVESSQLSYMPSNSLEDFDDSCFTFYYGDTNHMSVKPNSSMGDGTNGSGARYLLFSKDIKCALQVEEGPTPLIERSPYYQNGILNQLFSYLSSQEDCKVKRSTIASTSDISSHHSFHQYHRDLSLNAHDKASVNHRQHHATKHRHFSPTENGSLVQITDLSSLSDKLPLKETLALSVHPTEFIFIVTVTNVRSINPRIYVCMYEFQMFSFT